MDEELGAEHPLSHAMHELLATGALTADTRWPGRHLGAQGSVKQETFKIQALPEQFSPFYQKKK